MKHLDTFKTALAVVCMGALGAPALHAEGWPYGYDGVMLQGFYWDSFKDTKWTNLESQADDLSASFDLIWIPNSGKSASNPGMGYDPVYWFSNHNSSFGTEAELRSMMKTFKEKGTGMIADVVINHRSGVSNWTDFPSETWNGRTWHIGLDGICRTDEVNRQPTQQHGTGAADTGDDFDGSRDLDHTNANVQENCKNYCKFLLEDLGYTGFRYDMVKGYAGTYTGMYNKYSNPQFSVGEYYDSSYDKLAAWIESTGRESAAFDFAFKDAVTKAFGSGDLSQLVWMANGTNPQPAGLIHFGYPQYAVTFIDNHDTYRSWKFEGNWAAANAFMLSSPGTPCVFLVHWQACGDQIARMIAARKKAGVTNTSSVRVLKTASNVYMAEVTGTKGKLAVKIGSTMESPSGYSDSEIYCSGDGYCIWVKGGGDDPVEVPEKLYLLGHLAGHAWDTSYGIEMKREGNKFIAENVEFEAANAKDTNAYFSFVTTLGATWDVVNSSHRYGAASKDAPLASRQEAEMKQFRKDVDASSAYSWKISPGIHTIEADFAANKVRLDPASSAIGSVEAEVTEDAAPVYYNLQGIKVAAPTHGVYIVVRGRKVTKEVL